MENSHTDSLFSPDIKSVLIDENAIQRRVEELAKQIDHTYADCCSRENPLVLLCVLKGAFMFTCDLMRKLTIPVELDFLRMASYKSDTRSDRISLMHDTTTNIRNRNVLVVEDIVDTGETVNFMKFILSPRQPSSLRLVTLLYKEKRQQVEDDGSKPSYFGFKVPNKFVVGYGLDLDERFRSLPCICIIRGGVGGEGSSRPDDSTEQELSTALSDQLHGARITLNDSHLYPGGAVAEVPGTSSSSSGGNRSNCTSISSGDGSLTGVDGRTGMPPDLDLGEGHPQRFSSLSLDCEDDGDDNARPEGWNAMHNQHRPKRKQGF